MRASPLRQGLLAGILFLVVLWLSSSILSLLGKVRIAVSEAESTERELALLEEREAALEESLAALATERGRDYAIRTAFGVARSGEEVIVIVPPTEVVASSTPSWWERFLGWF